MTSLGRIRWILLALVGLAVAAGVSVAASQLVSQRIGLAAEPVSAGKDLAPPKHDSVQGRKDAARHTSTSTTAAPHTTTTTTTVSTVPSSTPTTTTPTAPPPASTSPSTGSQGGGTKGEPPDD